MSQWGVDIESAVLDPERMDLAREGEKWEAIEQLQFSLIRL
jgi:hypothetical protein